jgi:nitrate reductase NapE component
MFRKSEIYSHLLVTFIYFFIVSILSWTKLGVLGFWGILEIWFGALAGTFFLDIDHLLYWFVTNTEKEDSREVKTIWERRGIRGIREIWGILEKHHLEHTRLVFHSVIGQTVLALLAFYLITSGGSIFGSAMILSVNLHLLKDEWKDFKENKEHLKDWLFWQVRGNELRDNLKQYLICVTIIFGILTVLFV